MSEPRFHLGARIVSGAVGKRSWLKVGFGNDRREAVFGWLVGA